MHIITKFCRWVNMYAVHCKVVVIHLYLDYISDEIQPRLIAQYVTIFKLKR